MNIYNHIMSRNSSLEGHDFVHFLTNTRCAPAESLRFIPKMTFFVLGFRDMLEASRVKNPKNHLDEDINTHCEEDSGHWLWFLEDLEKLAKFGINISSECNYKTDILKNVWSDDTYVIRQHTYRVMSHIMNAKSTEEKLIIIDCLEAAFSSFITGLNHLTKNTGLYTTLRYFGQEHHEDEAGHSMGSWLEGDRQKTNDTPVLSQFKHKQMIHIIDDIFDGFEDVFSCWNDAVSTEVMAIEAIAV